MSYTPSDSTSARSQSFAALDTHRLSTSKYELPATWRDGDSTFLLVRIAENSWDVSSDGVLLGILSHVPPVAIGDADRWKISDPDHHDLGVGASWLSWEDAVANLADYRRGR